MNKKVVIGQPIASEGRLVLEKAGLEVYEMASYTPEALAEAASDAAGILIRNGQIPGWVIERCSALKVIGRHGVGVETIDVDAATRFGVQVTNAPLANSQAVAEHVVALLMALAKRIVPMHAAVGAGDFDMRHRDLTVELDGRTLAVLGLGNIGKRIANAASRGLSMRVIGYDPFLSPAAAKAAGVEAVEWERAFTEADFLSVNMPLNESTEGIISTTELGLLGPESYLINCARSQIVDTKALCTALQSGGIAGAAIDVFPSDPPPANFPLLKAPNTILTPHNAAHTHAAMLRMATHAARGIVEVLTGQPVSWPVNTIAPAGESGKR